MWISKKDLDFFEERWFDYDHLRISLIKNTPAFSTPISDEDVHKCLLDAAKSYKELRDLRQQKEAMELFRKGHDELIAYKKRREKEDDDKNAAIVRKQHHDFLENSKKFKYLVELIGGNKEEVYAHLLREYDGHYYLNKYFGANIVLVKMFDMSQVLSIEVVEDEEEANA